jgi:hypothetical protein
MRSINILKIEFSFIKGIQKFLEILGYDMPTLFHKVSIKTIGPGDLFDGSLDTTPSISCCVNGSSSQFNPSVSLSNQLVHFHCEQFIS